MEPMDDTMIAVPRAEWERLTRLQTAVEWLWNVIYQADGTPPADPIGPRPLDPEEKGWWLVARILWEID